MKTRIVVVLFCLLTVVAVPAAADTDGYGAPDTVDMVFSVIPDAATNQLQVQLDLWVFTDSNYVEGATMGFYWDNPNLQMDSALSSELTSESFEIGPFLYEGNDIDLTNANQRFLFGGALMMGPGLPPADYRRLWASYFFTLSEWNADDSIVIDTMYFNNASLFRFVGAGVGEYIPVWEGKDVQHDTSYVPQVNIMATPDSLHFSGIEGGADPPMQSFQIQTDGDPVDFELVEAIDWLIVSPLQGTTVQTINAQVNTIGLSAGTYVDSIRVDAPEAVNSPIYVITSLTLEPPPPVIGIDPDEFFFNAIAGGDDPTPKTMTVSNIGGSTLNWTLSNMESWLDLDPEFGTDFDEVTLNVDITGLTFGDYYDTIVVSDPNATNDPVLVPVSLSVGSDLPVIEADSAFNTIIVPSGVSEIPDRMVLIYNGGAGTMNFWLEENSGRIQNLVPGSGTAPQEVAVSFKVLGGQPGNDYWDTLWVYSNEAINSPFPVVFYFHYVENPALMNVNRDTLDLLVFECSQGWMNLLPSDNFLVSNLGGDNPMPVNLIYESDYFTLNSDTGTASVPFTVLANDLQLPLGIYYDTILVSAPNAINSPLTIIVAYHMIAALQDPEILLTKDDFVIPTQENSGPTPPVAFEIWNRFGGCMEWELIEDVPWMFPNNLSGVAPATTSFNVNSSGFPFGEYADTFQVVAPSATNSPQDVTVLMRVWRFHGDNDYSSMINVIDLIYLVNYMFNNGPQPQPELMVGNLNCDHSVNIEDLIYM
ncbi:MAG: hypothetical protein U9R56_01370, partial [candidate division Zixibacteria bacterium]|nr:hypothetical protein [candidate division Zixibacteria bacterium]